MGTTKQDSSTARQVNRDQLECVRGLLGFARSSPEEKGHKELVSLKGLDVIGQEVTIRNARPIVDELSLDLEGFVLVKHKTACANERNPLIVRDRYLEEMVPFIKDYFKASLVVPYRNSVFVRNASVAGRYGAARMAHLDYTPLVAPVMQRGRTCGTAYRCSSTPG